jgi:hypothetical protein
MVLSALKDKKPEVEKSSFISVKFLAGNGIFFNLIQ